MLRLGPGRVNGYGPPDFTDVAAQKAGYGSGGRELDPFLPHVNDNLVGDCGIEARAT